MEKKDNEKVKVCLWNTMPPAATESEKSYFYHEGQSQGHRVIDLGVIWKGIISWVSMPNMKPLSLRV